MIKVRYQSRSSLHNVQAHGWDFKDNNDLFTKGPHFGSPGLNWKQYVEWLKEKDTSCLRIWVNDELIWSYDQKGE